MLIYRINIALVPFQSVRGLLTGITDFLDFNTLFIFTLLH